MKLVSYNICIVIWVYDIGALNNQLLLWDMWEYVNVYLFNHMPPTWARWKANGHWLSRCEYARKIENINYSQRRDEVA